MKERGVTFVLFGGTGDLTRKKLAPAFSSLMQTSDVKKKSRIIGIARKDFSEEEYKKFLIGSVENEKEKKCIKNFDVKYLNGDFSDEDLYSKLAGLLNKCEPKFGCNRIYYLSTSFKFFPEIVNNIKKFNLQGQKEFFTRIVFEKPFGENLASSIKLDEAIHEVFPEKDVYRIDHYLAKETVQNINILKFANPIFYGAFNNKFIESIEIVLDENAGVGNRIEYYDSAGAIKDMVQNHLLQILGRILMRKPEKFNYQKMHKEKIRVLKNLEVLPAENHLLGQYESYRKEAVKIGKKNSLTETFAKIVLNCATPEWNGVKLILRTGKKLRRKFGQIQINYKLEKGIGEMLDCSSSNKITLGIYPTLDVSIIMNTGNPLQENSVAPVSFDFSREREFGPNTTQVYATLLGEIVEGNKTIFAKDDTVRECWKVTEKILAMKNKMKFVRYVDGEEPENLQHDKS